MMDDELFAAAQALRDATVADRVRWALYSLLVQVPVADAAREDLTYAEGVLSQAETLGAATTQEDRVRVALAGSARAFNLVAPAIRQEASRSSVAAIRGTIGAVLAGEKVETESLRAAIDFFSRLSRVTLEACFADAPDSEPDFPVPPVPHGAQP